MTEVRLSVCGPPDAIRKGLTGDREPVIRLAHVPGTQGDATLREVTGRGRPAILISYVYLEGFQRDRGGYQFRNWMLDSGAFSAWKSGKEIELPEYIDACLGLMAEDPELVEIIGLDVIGDASELIEHPTAEHIARRIMAHIGGRCIEVQVEETEGSVAKCIR